MTSRRGGLGSALEARRMERGRGRNLLIATLLASLLAGAAAGSVHHVSAYTPQKGDSFGYSETITVNNGQGSYTGYNDQQQITGSEQVDGVNGSVVSASYTYSFQYSNNQGSSTSGSSSGPYTWSLDNYTYINGTDNQVGYSKPIYLWFAMNPSTPVGATFFVLNTQFTVLSQNYSFQLPKEGKYIQTIQAQGSGEFQRNDAYGVFTASYTWDEYFDPVTGYIVGYNYVEQDNGQYQGQAGSFTYTDDLFVTSTSYPLTEASAPPTGTTTFTTTTSTSSVPGVSVPYLGIIVVVGIALLIIVIAAAYAAGRRRRRDVLPQHSPPPSAPPPAQWQSGVDLGSRPPEQVVIRDVAKVNCRYCGTLIPTTAQTCPYCGAPRQ